MEDGRRHFRRIHAHNPRTRIATLNVLTLYITMGFVIFDSQVSLDLVLRTFSVALLSRSLESWNSKRFTKHTSRDNFYEILRSVLFYSE